MAGFRASSTGAKAALLGGGLALAALAAYGGWSLRQSAGVPKVVVDQAAVVDSGKPSEPAVAPVAQIDPVPDAQTAAAPLADAVAVATPVPPVAVANPDLVAVKPVPPSFDVVRIDPDGTAVVAGQAVPGSKVILRVDGVEITATTADASGKFVALFVLDSSAAPRALTMFSVSPDKTTLLAAAEVAIAPTQKPPVAVADDAAVVPTPAPVTPAPVAVAEAPSTLLVTKNGVSVLQSPVASDTATALAIDTISYTPSGEVQLAGHAAPDTVLRFYLNNAPLADVTVGKDARWSATMPPIEPGIYTLRADQLAADGSVTARFETPFKRETQAALAAAAQSPPPKAEVGIAAADTSPSVVAEAEATATPDVAQDTAATTVAEPPLPVVADAVAAPVVNAEATAPATPPPAVSITVQPGFTLWGIASQQFGDGIMYVQVFEANKDKIRDPNLIYPGQVFVIPKASN